jgi:hypothetical protein
MLTAIGAQVEGPIGCAVLVVILLSLLLWAILWIALAIVGTDLALTIVRH